MIEIKLEEKIFQVRNLFSEMTIDEYQKIIELFKDEKLNNISLWLEIFEVLKWDEELVDNLDYNSFEEITTKFDFTEINGDIIRTIDNYECYPEDGTFKLKVRDLLKVEEYFREEDYLAKIAATIYKTIGSTKEEDIKNWDNKVKTFKNMNAAIITPILKEINISLTKKNKINE